MFVTRLLERWSWSRVYNQASPWPLFTARQSTSMDAPRLQVLRYTAGQVSHVSSPVWPDSQVLSATCQVPDTAFMRRLRLLFLPWVLLQAARALRSLVAFAA